MVTVAGSHWSGTRPTLQAADWDRPAWPAAAGCPPAWLPAAGGVQYPVLGSAGQTAAMQQPPGAGHPAQGLAALTADGQQTPAAGGRQCHVKGSVEGSARPRRTPAAGALQPPVQGSAALTSAPAPQASHPVGCPGPMAAAQPALRDAPSLQPPPAAGSDVCPAAEGRHDGSCHCRPAPEQARQPAAADALEAGSLQGCCCPLPVLTVCLQQHSTRVSVHPNRCSLTAPPKTTQAWLRPVIVTPSSATEGTCWGSACEISQGGHAHQAPLALTQVSNRWRRCTGPTLSASFSTLEPTWLVSAACHP